MKANILTAMDDPNLFKPFFKGDSWGPWRAFLAGLFALPMDEAALELFQRHTGRTVAPEKAFTEAALVIGRRGGKSRVLATIAVFLATFRDYEPHLAPGEVATIGILATDRKQARAIFRYVSGLLNEVPLLKGLIADETGETITLKNRVVIEIATASFRSTRGYSYAAVLMDEVAFLRDETGANPADEIVKALRPGLSSIPGSVLLLASSPYRKSGVLYNTFQRHYGKDDGRVLVWKAATLEMNPSLDPRIVEEAYAEDPENADAEYGGNFRSDLSDFVPRDVVDSCIMRGVHAIPPSSGTFYTAWVDPSGGTGGDSYTMAIAHRDKDSVILDAIMEIRPPFSPENATAEVANMLKQYKVTRVTGDRYAGDWPREALRKHGITYDLSDRPASDVYRDFLPVLNSGQAQLLDQSRMIAQLCALERRTSRSGKDQISHPVGGHDDIANSVAGAMLMVKSKAQPMKISKDFLDKLGPDRYADRYGRGRMGGGW